MSCRMRRDETATTTATTTTTNTEESRRSKNSEELGVFDDDGEEMDATAVSRWIAGVMATPQVTGAILIDASTGLCLGAAGKATEEDATFLTVASRSALDADGVGAVSYKDSRVILRKGDAGVLVAVYKEKGSN